jgi:hypothetical protein
VARRVELGTRVQGYGGPRLRGGDDCGVGTYALKPARIARLAATAPNIGKCDGHSRAEQAVVGSSEEQGDGQAEVDDTVAEAFRDAFDKAVQAQPAQLIGDGAQGDRGRVVSR